MAVSGTFGNPGAAEGATNVTELHARPPPRCKACRAAPQYSAVGYFCVIR
jgi:hypothetical protein